MFEEEMSQPGEVIKNDLASRKREKSGEDAG
jgi:hypothetical protein